jgi:hypothetical protein
VVRVALLVTALRGMDALLGVCSVLCMCVCVCQCVCVRESTVHIHFTRDVPDCVIMPDQCQPTALWILSLRGENHLKLSDSAIVLFGRA